MTPFRDEFLARFRWIDGHADMLGLFAEDGFLREAAAAVAEPFRNRGVTKVAAVEARGFVLGAATALELGAGFVAVRKEGSVHPGPKAERRTAPDWRGHEHLLRVQRSAFDTDDVVLLVDDWAEVGSQAAAARALIEDCGATYAGLSLLVDELGEDARKSLAPVHSVVSGDELPPS
jgi:adenine phosphoribosyltransferase